MRQETRAAHDALDAGLGAFAIGGDGDFGAFLRVQYAARLPIENWLAVQDSGAITPPPQTHLIAADLAELNLAAPPDFGAFPLQHSGALTGVAWTLAGSSLGNRAMLAQRRKLGLNGADRFLSDDAMPQFWKALRPTLDTIASPEAAHHAVTGANAVFALFRLAANHYTIKEVA
ncbi:biliverdin-producing heme oxygenase [Qipengyuania marisflavi]|uniref:Biliverdin-producing heme oxygenase n=1 Tax=Qipengyuania marisflavi TaxID=2486356 RepID=A0A5S3P0S3_9SPHN|nr:biliverdin-producing heme oxygenase [Qipengyuania marisflavi]TMM46131.1 biliverdin-producing heme oxygenase [Qipengyuania marisflavi]